MNRGRFFSFSSFHIRSPVTHSFCPVTLNPHTFQMTLQLETQSHSTCKRFIWFRIMLLQIDHNKSTSISPTSSERMTYPHLCLPSSGLHFTSHVPAFVDTSSSSTGFVHTEIDAVTLPSSNLIITPLRNHGNQNLLCSVNG